MDRGYRGAVAVPQKNAALETDRFENPGQRLARLPRHIVERARQFDGIRLAVARAGIGENAQAGHLREAARKIAPQRDTAQALVQHDDRRRAARRGPVANVFQPLAPDGDKSRDVVAPVETGHVHVPFNLKRWILPVAVFGNSAVNSIQRGYFHLPTRALTCSFNSASRPPTATPLFSTTKAFGFSRSSSSRAGTTAASSTLGWAISACSTSNGATQMPLTLNMSSVRPQ